MTRFANRKSQIRGFQAAHPGMLYAVAARHVDTLNTAELLTSLNPTPMVALAAALNTAGELTFAAELAHTIADEQAPDPEADRLRQAVNDAYFAMVNAPATLPAAAREALEQAYDNADNALYYHNPADLYAYEDERAVVFAAFAALSAATTRADNAPALARAAADVLAMLRFDFTADAIRGHEAEAVPAAADSPAARYARRAAEALSAATKIKVGRDEDWRDCIDLLDQALRLANDAASFRPHEDGAGLLSSP